MVFEYHFDRMPEYPNRGRLCQGIWLQAKPGPDRMASPKPAGRPTDLARQPAEGPIYYCERGRENRIPRLLPGRAKITLGQGVWS
jgi:hypothetical protein